ncbi:hypothetical protein QCA50_005351 [Cerrena zonata]|uniref:Uncharacterized protein n=1 Tax=Cerrena zonata TaxID=2478898 RepID=A0AAW0GGP1_9APHY
MSVTTDPRRRETFMGLMTKAGEPDLSYEEVRFKDYLHAYQTTGRGPQPCPQQPTDPHERKARGLPPLFEPHIEIIATNGSNQPVVPIVPPVLPLFRSPSPVTVVADPESLPETQIFQPTTGKPEPGSSPETFQSIVYQTLYSNFSFEELRCLAYRKGKKEAPEAITSQALVVAPPALLISPPSLSTSQQLSLTSGNESFQAISCLPPYAKHSPEELRIAYIRAGRELTSEEIIAQNAILKMF